MCSVSRSSCHEASLSSAIWHSCSWEKQFNPSKDFSQVRYQGRSPYNISRKQYPRLSRSSYAQGCHAKMVVTMATWQEHCCELESGKSLVVVQHGMTTMSLQTCQEYAVFAYTFTQSCWPLTPHWHTISILRTCCVAVHCILQCKYTSSSDYQVNTSHSL